MAHLYTKPRSENYTYVDSLGGYTTNCVDRYIVLDTNDEKLQFVKSLKVLINTCELCDSLRISLFDVNNNRLKRQYYKVTRQWVHNMRAYNQLPWYTALFTLPPSRPEILQVNTTLSDSLKSLPQNTDLLHKPIPEDLYLKVVKGYI